MSKDEPPSKRQKNKTKASHITPKIEDLINHFEENGSAEPPGCGTSLRNLWDNCTRATGRRHADEFDAGCASCRFMSMAYEKTKINKKRKDGGGPSGEQGRKEIPTRALRNKRKKVETKVETRTTTTTTTAAITVTTTMSSCGTPGSARGNFERPLRGASACKGASRKFWS